MTKGARVAYEGKVNKEIADRKIAHETEENRLNRNHQVGIENARNKTTLWAAGISGALNALGKLGSKVNDPQWYKKYISDLEKFVNVPTYDRLGTPRFAYFGDCSTTDSISRAMPGVLVFHHIPMIGGQQAGFTAIKDNPVNRILSRTKEIVLSKNSRSSVDWEPCDLGLNFFCSADIMTAILELGRVLRVYRTYRGKNAYLAEALITALGWSYADIVANYAQYRKCYTIMATRFNRSIVAPADLSLYARRAYLAHNIFGDIGDVKEVRQMYAFVQDAFFELNYAGAQAELKHSNLRTSISTYITGLNNMFSAITDDPDYVEMYQDLRHAWGDKLIKLPELPDDEEVAFNVEPLNREQIHNLKMLPITFNSTTGLPVHATITNARFNIRQDGGYLYQGSNGTTDRRVYWFPIGSGKTEVDRLNTRYFGPESKLIYNMFKDEVTGDDILDITRFNFTGVVTNSSEHPQAAEFNILDCGTELITSAFIYQYKLDMSSGVTSLEEIPYSTHLYEYPTTDADTIMQEMVFFSRITSAVSKFGWAPITTVCHAYDDEQHNNLYFEACTTFLIDRVTLRSINEACVLSELFIADGDFIR